MKTRFNRGEISLEAEPETRFARERSDSDTPFCIAILGNFSGRSANTGNGSRPTINRPIEIDRDNFDEVFARFHPELQLPLGEELGTLTLHFSELDDFHPDRLLHSCSMFKRLVDLREQLQNPATFSAAASTLGLSSSPRQKTTGQPTATQRPPLPNSGSLLDAIVGDSAPSAYSPKRDQLREFVDRVVQPQLADAVDPRQHDAVAMIDRALSSQVRALLHVPAFQQLEALWRSVFFLISRLETSSQLKVSILDASKLSLGKAFTTLDEFADQGDPWSVVVAAFEFGASPQDFDILADAATRASELEATFLAGASLRLMGIDSLEQLRDIRTRRDIPAGWTALRHLPEACYLGLVLPRFLLRLPYGSLTAPCESFEFEEMDKDSGHEDYLWGNSAVACALLLAQSFSDDEWSMRPGTHHELDRLPLHVFQRDGDSSITSCAEVLLTQESVENILDAGLMPMIWMKNTDVVRLARFQSIASPATRLMGRWNS